MIKSDTIHLHTYIHRYIQTEKQTDIIHTAENQSHGSDRPINRKSGRVTQLHNDVVLFHSYIDPDSIFSVCDCRANKQH